LEFLNDPAVRLLFDLVSTPSPSGREHAAANLFASRLPSLGWESVEIDEVGNVIATKGSGSEEFILLGHIDTVFGGPPVRLEGNTLWGRGSVDAKGPLCAFAAAGGQAAVSPGRRRTLIAAVSEETDSAGTRHRLPLHRPAACLVGEPSGTDGITIAYRGYLQVRLSAEDAGSHRSSGTSPLTACLQAAADILEALQRTDDGGKPIIERTTANVLSMVSSEEDGRKASIDLDIRLPLGAVPEEIFRFCAGKAEERSTLARLVSGVCAHAGERNNPLVRALRAAIREEGGTPRLLAKGGTADFNYAAAWGCPMAAWGPGDSRLDHTGEERIDLDEYLRSIRVLARILS
jgi:LysW-gamma-L-lysine carboxypeptidase